VSLKLEGQGARIGKERSARRFFQLGGSKGSCRVDGVVGEGEPQEDGGGWR